jgi:hypothetical protein
MASPTAGITLLTPASATATAAAKSASRMLLLLIAVGGLFTPLPILRLLLQPLCIAAAEGW